MKLSFTMTEIRTLMTQRCLQEERALSARVPQIQALAEEVVALLAQQEGSQDWDTVCQEVAVLTDSRGKLYNLYHEEHRDVCVYACASRLADVPMDEAIEKAWECFYRYGHDPGLSGENIPLLRATEDLAWVLFLQLKQLQSFFHVQEGLENLVRRLEE